MDLSGGLTAGHVLWDLNGTGGQVVISSGATVEGIFLAPDRGITVDNGTVLGAVVGGGGVNDSHSNFVSVHSSSEITGVPVPLPASAWSGMALLGLLVAGRAVAHRRHRAIA